MRAEVKRRIEQKRRFRIRNKVKGTADRPRMSVRFTERNIYVQFIDDVEGKTLASASTATRNRPIATSLSPTRFRLSKSAK